MTTQIACGMLVWQQGIEPMPPAAVAQIPSHWAAKEVQNHILPYLTIQKSLSFPDFLSTEITIIRSLGLGFQNVSMHDQMQSVSIPFWSLLSHLTIYHSYVSMSEHNSFFINCLAFCCLDALEFSFNSHEVSTGRDLNYFCVLIQQCCSRHLGAHIFAHYSKLLFVAQSCPTLATPWSVVCQAPLSIGFSRQEYWSGLPWIFPTQGLNSSLLLGRWIFYHCTTWKALTLSCL